MALGGVAVGLVTPKGDVQPSLSFSLGILLNMSALGWRKLFCSLLGHLGGTWWSPKAEQGAGRTAAGGEPCPVPTSGPQGWGFLLSLCGTPIPAQCQTCGSFTFGVKSAFVPPRGCQALKASASPLPSRGISQATPFIRRYPSVVSPLRG